MMAKFILAAAAAVFLTLAIASITKTGGKASPAARTWLIVGLIFAAVSIWLW